MFGFRYRNGITAAAGAGGSPVAPGIGLPDDDDDGIPNVNDPEHDDYDPEHPGSDPDDDGIPNVTDPDDDGDGTIDPDDEDHPDYDPDLDTDDDGTPDDEDEDDDDDGIPDIDDPAPKNPNVPGPMLPELDSDDDGIPDNVDTDDDGDGIPDVNDPDHPDYDPEHPDSDPDDDDDPNVTDPDDDGDTIPDVNDPDHPDYDPEHPDSDPDDDDIPNVTDPDDDGDGIPDEDDPDHPDYVGGVPDFEPPSPAVIVADFRTGSYNHSGVGSFDIDLQWLSEVTGLYVHLERVADVGVRAVYDEQVTGNMSFTGDLSDTIHAMADDDGLTILIEYGCRPRDGYDDFFASAFGDNPVGAEINIDYYCDWGISGEHGTEPGATDPADNEYKTDHTNYWDRVSTEEQSRWLAITVQGGTLSVSIGGAAAISLACSENALVGLESSSRIYVNEQTIVRSIRIYDPVAAVDLPDYSGYGDGVSDEYIWPEE